MVRLYFVRHGQSQSNETRTIAGQSDKPLTDTGIEEAEEIRKQLPANYSALYSSHLVRCQKTAEVINQIGIPITYDQRLLERNFGSLTGKGYDEVELLDPEFWIRDHEQHYDYRPYGGESVDDVATRLKSFVEDVVSKSRPGDTVVVVTSAGIIRLMHHLYGTTLPEGRVPNASLHTFSFERS